MKPRKDTRLHGNGRSAGKNPQQDDSPERDVHHDEKRRNLFDPEVARNLRPASPVSRKRD